MIDLRKFLMKNSDGKPCVITTMFVVGFIIVNIKLIISGLTIGGYTMANFSGSDYAASIGALGAIYVMRRGQHKKDKENNND